MANRNESLVKEIVAFLGGTRVSEKALLQHLKHRLILDVGNVDDVAEFAEDLRLNITKAECSQVLDHIAEKGMVGITIEIVDEAINELFDNRFIEPGEEG